MPQDQRAVLELLYKVSREFATALDLKTVLTRVLFSAINNIGGERGSIVVMDDTGRAVDSAIVYGNKIHESTTLQLKDTVERGLAGWVVRSREAVLIPDTSMDSRWLRREDDAIERSGAKSAMCVPLMVREKLVGVLTLVHSMPKAYNDEHLELMQAIADQAGIFVLNGRLFSESQRQARVMTALAEGAVQLNQFVRLDDVFDNILSQTRQALQVDIAALGMVEGDELVFRAATDKGKSLIGKCVKLRDGVAGLVAREERGVIIPTVFSGTLLADAEKIPNIKVRALACAPIHVQGKVIGVLEAFNPVTKSFDPDALLVLTGLGSLAGTSIQNAELFESLDVAHKRYRDLFEDSIDPIVITDIHGRILEVNKQASVFTGHSPDALHEFLIEQVHDVNFEKTGQQFEKIGDSTLIYESTLYDSHGGIHPAEIYVRRVIFNQSESIQWILRDITERKDLDSLREDLAAMIYHDLRSPLANILSSVEMLDSILPEEEKETTAPIMRIAHHSIDRIQRLISSLLDLNRLEQNQPVGERQAVSVSLLVNDAIEAVNPSAEGREQIVALKIAADLPSIFVDVDMIRRVMINLLENAVKYTPFGGHIEIGAETDGDFLRVHVQDDGPGIPEVDRERIFDKFTRLKNKTGSSGLGVGLAFCKLAVQGHGGKIWIEPAPERGSKFLFTIPIAKE
jgi:two-component system, NtrC family, sensor histidine kinase KinB